MLRRSGCKLLVEVLVDSPSEYNATICEDVLPSLNARCRILSDIYNTATAVMPLKSYQFKIFSILFSTFQNVLFLDADAFPAHDPTHLFTNAPFTTHGLVTWPDFWAMGASPHYHHIAGIPEVPRATRLSTESGQLMLDKAKHSESLLMMVYYNYYGQDYYSPLLGQGGAGAGDKDTFLPAAMAVDAPFCQVRHPILALGRFHRKREGDFHAAAMAQANPIVDYNYKTPHQSHVYTQVEWLPEDTSNGRKDQKVMGVAQGPYTKARPFFLHCSMFKFDPAKS